LLSYYTFLMRVWQFLGCVALACRGLMSCRNELNHTDGYITWPEFDNPMRRNYECH